MSSVIDFTHGSVTTSGQGSMDIWVRYRRNIDTQERPIHEAVRDPQSGLKEDGGILEITNSSTFANGKNWTKRRIQFPNGSFVTFSIRRMLSSGVFSQSMHNMVISPRESAPLQEIAIDVPFVAGKNTLSVVYITGRFDIMTVHDIKTKKLHINAQGANDLESYDISELDDFVSLRVMEKELRPRVKTSVIKTGRKGTVVTRIRRQRRINL